MRQHSSLKPVVGFVISVLVGGFLSVSAQPTAYATHKKGSTEGWLNDNSWRICLYSGLGGQAAWERAFDLVSVTNVNANVSCSGSSNMDARTDYYPDNWYGSNACTGSLNTTTMACTHKTARLNLGMTENSAQQRRKTTLHEVGHVGGLGHRYTNDSCMTGGESPPIVDVFDDHDRDALNSTY